jgi:hypothetical protein
VRALRGVRREAGEQTRWAAMGSMTPVRGELAQRIRAASARLRSPCRAVGTPARRRREYESSRHSCCSASADDEGGAELDSNKQKGQALGEEHDRREGGAHRREVAPHSPPPVHERREETGDAAGHVDLRALRAQLERSLARLQAGEFSPKPVFAGAPVPERLSFANGVWARNAVEHWDGRRRRKLARAALLCWRHMQYDRPALAQLQGEIENAHMQLAAYRDPARTQVVTWLQSCMRIHFLL